MATFFFLNKTPKVLNTHDHEKKAISLWKFSCTGVITNNHCILHPEYITILLSIGFISPKLLKEKFGGI